MIRFLQCEPYVLLTLSVSSNNELWVTVSTDRYRKFYSLDARGLRSLFSWDRPQGRWYSDSAPDALEFSVKPGGVWIGVRRDIFPVPDWVGEAFIYYAEQVIDAGRNRKSA